MVVVIENKDDLMKMFKEVAEQIYQANESRKKKFMNPTEFAEHIGMSANYFKNNLLGDPDFKNAVVKVDRKTYIIVEIGEELSVEVMKKWRM